MKAEAPAAVTHPAPLLPTASYIPGLNNPSATVALVHSRSHPHCPYVQRGKDVPFSVVTPKGGMPQTITSPFAIKYDIVQNDGGESVAFRKMLEENKA